VKALERITAGEASAGVMTMSLLPGIAPVRSKVAERTLALLLNVFVPGMGSRPAAFNLT
jgi:hypothetical protein